MFMLDSPYHVAKLKNLRTFFFFFLLSTWNIFVIYSSLDLYGLLNTHFSQQVCSFSRLPSFHAASLELQFVTLERNTEILLREEFPDASFPLLSLQVCGTSPVKCCVFLNFSGNWQCQQARQYLLKQCMERKTSWD